MKNYFPVLLLLLSVNIYAKASESVAGNIRTDAMSVIVDGHRLEVEPLVRGVVKGEPVKLTAREASGYGTGNRLRFPPKNENLNMLGSFIEGTLSVRDSTGRMLTKNVDYIVSPEFGMLALAPQSTLKIGSTVFASYEYSLQRIDALVADAKGKLRIIKGMTALKSPAIPAIPEGYSLVCNIYLQYGCTELTDFNIFIPSGSPIITATRASSSLRKVIERLSRGEKIKIVCWGDSITVGADVEQPMSWVERFTRMVRTAYPNAQIEILNYGIGSSTCESWIKNDDGFKHLSDNYGLVKGLTYEKLLAERADIIVMEFFNDTMLPTERLEPLYNKMLADFRAADSEWVIMSPSTHLAKYDIKVMKHGDDRPLIPFLRDFTLRNDISFADAFARWENLHIEGIPFFALFNNGFNHPNEFGHSLFVEELEKIFL